MTAKRELEQNSPCKHTWGCSGQECQRKGLLSRDICVILQPFTINNVQNEKWSWMSSLIALQVQPSMLKSSPICMSALFLTSRDSYYLTYWGDCSSVVTYQVSKFFLLPNSYKKLFLAPLLGIAKGERSPLFLQVFLTCICSNFSPFFLVTFLIFTLLLVSPLDIPYNLCTSLKAHLSKLSTAHYRNSPTMAEVESFSPMFHGNHTVSLPDFIGLRGWCIHYVIWWTAWILMCHAAAWHLFSSSMLI